MIHPCCGHSLQKGTKLIAFIDMGLNICAVIFHLILIVIVFASGYDLPVPVPSDNPVIPGSNTSTPTPLPTIPPAVIEEMFGIERKSLIIIFVFATCVYTGLFYFARFLFHAAMERDFEKVNIWYLVAWIILLARVVVHLIGLNYSLIYFGGLGFFQFLFQLYSLWVVGAFGDELARGQIFRDDETYYLTRGMNTHYFKM